MMNRFFSLIILVTLVTFSCQESQELKDMRMEIHNAEEINAALIEKSKTEGYTVSQEMQRSLEGHAILFMNYFQDEGEVDLEMTGKLIEYLDYYRENNDDYFNTDPGFQSYLPLIYGIQASLLSDDRTLATESTKISLRGFEELLEDFPDDPTLNIYYTVILGAIPNVFKTQKKTWEQTLRLDKMLVDNQWEENVPPGLRKIIYKKAVRLAGDFDPEREAYFQTKLEKIEKSGE